MDLVLPAFVALWALLWALLEAREPGAPIIHAVQEVHQPDKHVSDAAVALDPAQVSSESASQHRRDIVHNDDDDDSKSDDSNHNSSGSDDNIRLALLKNLRKTRDQVKPRSADGKIAIGFNVCVDAVVDALELLQKSGVEPVQGKLPQSVTSLDDVGEIFTHLFERAAGGERFVEDDETFASLEDGLAQCDSRRLLLGGNAAIMAVVFARDWNFKHISLGGPIGPFAEPLLPAQVATFSLDEGEDVLGVKTKADEVHIIMEYKKGSKWAGSAARRANRFIVSRDLSNAVIAALEPLMEHVRDAPDGPFDLLIAAGLHMLDAMEADVQRKRVGEIAESFRSLPAETLIHFELAAVGKPILLEELGTRILPEVDSLGLNEQEIGALYVALGLDGVNLDAVTGLVPDVEAVTKIITDILAGAERLGRIHFHCFGYHVLALKKASIDRWPHATSSVAAGSVKASERACASANLGAQDVTLQLHGPIRFAGSQREYRVTPESPVIEHETETLYFALAPVLTCNEPVQTVGLGDSISASALAYQI
ncbi:ADP-dependent glucokinase [Hondaea fermentalgiana]|uniref:ADP-dependent glucokinase n=1 Tax=Hondaea fermentalgiana TaxID=2315210 RepID=A0A2R5GUY4_9STRA|nr:ADP-dependent glucokinase [Hondaea fermentalgiana]|eukprot:GBG34129.1 ADP-dependent glucokinase [Hondaea fermentalgiana]